MSNKFIRIVILSITITIVIVGAVLTLTALYPREVTLSYTNDSPMPIDIYRAKQANNQNNDYKKSGEAIQTVTATTTARLRPGKYIAIHDKNDSYAHAAVSFDVPANETITITPSLSNQSLQKKLMEEKKNILQHTSINTKKHKLIGIKLYGLGNWASVTAQYSSGDYYHDILEKQGEDWKSLTIPAIVFSQPTYKKIPHTILRAVNDIQYDPAS